MHKILHHLIGQKITHENQLCVLIEILDDGPYLVFQCQNTKKIQCNQFGNANRKASPTYTIHCLNELKDDLHPLLKKLLPASQQKPFLNQLLNQA